ncbi:DUF7927 domain-containing protein [Leucobacter sp. USHLN153]|uniref:DUF7927 domain-containing protein n=1 Tax=Leucobacter sp. USHLN153 TaxID=3081268 RepID=UPI00301843A1
MFRTNGLNMPNHPNRFVSFSVDAAETACGNGRYPAKLRFYLEDSAKKQTPVGDTPISPCTDSRTSTVNGPRNYLPQVKYGSYKSGGSILVMGTSYNVVLKNAEGNESGNDSAFDNIRVLDVSPNLDKSFNPTRVAVGGKSRLTLTVTNTNELGAKNGWAFTDTLPSGLTLASPANLAKTCDATVTAPNGGTQITVTAGKLAANVTSCTIQVDVTSNRPLPTENPSVVFQNGPSNMTTLIGLVPPNTASVEFYSTPRLEVKKSSNASATTAAGDTVTYTVEATNVGNGPFTTSNNAVVWDDLVGVIDDGDLVAGSPAAKIDGAAVAVPTRIANALLWKGALGSGKKVVITYQVKLKKGGDRQVKNVAFVPPAGSSTTTPPTTPVGECGKNNPQVSCVTYELLLPKLEVSKTSAYDQKTGIVTYTIKVRNTGSGHARGTLAVDTMSGALDSATYQSNIKMNPALTGIGVSVSGTAPNITATIAAASGQFLAPGATATATYTVKVNNPATGDGDLLNYIAATDGAGGAATGCTAADLVLMKTTLNQTAFALCSWTTDRVPVLTIKKTADKSVMTSAGEVVTFTITVKNEGKGALSGFTFNGTRGQNPIVTDALNKVSDDAQIVWTAAAPVNGGDGFYNEAGTAYWNGSLAAGATKTLTYQAKALTTTTGDNILDNTACLAAPIVIKGDRCSQVKVTMQPKLEVSKTSAYDQKTGIVKYTLNVRNTGAGSAKQSVIPTLASDTASGVLDDATYQNDFAMVAPLVTGVQAAASGTAPNTTFAIKLAASGAFASGASAKATYSVKVNNPATGNSRLLNYIAASTVDGKLTTCADKLTTMTTTPNSTAWGVCSWTTDLVPVLTIAKTANKSVMTAAGEVVTYTITVKNEGPGALNGFTYTGTKGQNPIVTDVLSKVTDDAQLVWTAAAPVTGGDGFYENAGTAYWNGSLAAGATKTLTYQAKALTTTTGDNILDNTACLAAPIVIKGARCSQVKVTLQPKLEVSKTSSYDQKTGIVSYTLNVRNTGAGSAKQSVIPVLAADTSSGVLDDATYQNDLKLVAPLVTGVQVKSSGTAPNLKFEIPLASGGAFASGAAAKATYSVKVNNPATGDGAILNYIAASTFDGKLTTCDDKLTTMKTTRNSTAWGVCSWTTDLKPVLSIKKTADKTQLTALNEVVTFTIDVKNEGPGDLNGFAFTGTKGQNPVVTDVLSKVSDDAQLVWTAPAPVNGGDGFYNEAGTAYWNGTLKAGETKKLTYQAKIVSSTGGDRVLDNTACLAAPILVKGDRCSQVQVPLRLPPKLEVSKTSAYDQKTGIVTYTLNVRNTGLGYAEQSVIPVLAEDTLSGILDDAAYQNDFKLVAPLVTGVEAKVVGTAPNTKLQIALASGKSLAPSATVKATYSVKVNNPATGNGTLLNYIAASTVDGKLTTCADKLVQMNTTLNSTAWGVCSWTTDLTPVLSIKKTADKSTMTAAGEVVTFSIEVKNEGRGDLNGFTFTGTKGQNPIVTDVLSKVTDDAQLVWTAAAPVSGGDGFYNEAGTAYWNGTLKAGETKKFTYQAKLVSGTYGDGVLDNTACLANPIVIKGERCSQVKVTLLPKLEVSKTSAYDQTTGIVKYTLNVRNAGMGAAKQSVIPTLASDTASGVLDDATYQNDFVLVAPLVTGVQAAASGTAPNMTFAMKLAASASFAPGATAKATYSVKVNNPATGNGTLLNYIAASTFDGKLTTCDDKLAQMSTTPNSTAWGVCSWTTDLTPVLSIKKSADKSTMTAAGEVVTYTIEVKNEGKGDLNGFTFTGTKGQNPIVTDVLSKVTDDAQLVWTAPAPTNGGDGFYNDAGIAYWNGVLKAGETKKLTYQAKASNITTGDNVLDNTACLANPVLVKGERCSQVKVTMQPKLEVSKTSVYDQKTGVVSYSLNVRNTGAGSAKQSVIPVLAADTPSGVLDDATYQNDVKLVAPLVTGVQVKSSGTAPNLKFEIPLASGGAFASGAAAKATYSVKVNNPATGDGQMLNYIAASTIEGKFTTCDDKLTTMKTTPSSTAWGVCSWTTDLKPVLSIKKTADKSELFGLGEVVTFTIDVKNEGPGDLKDFTFTGTKGQNPVVTDALSKVSDDAEIVWTASAPANGGDGFYTEAGTAYWNGALKAGETKKLTYQAKVVKGKVGDYVLDNTACLADPLLVKGDRCSQVTVNRAGLAVSKTGVPEQKKDVSPGENVSYTLSFFNPGKAPATVNSVDVLDGLLDDAVVNSDVSVAGGALTVTREGDAAKGRLVIKGSVAPGATVTVKYSATVKEYKDAKGDHELLNVLLASPELPTDCDVEGVFCWWNPVPPPTFTLSLPFTGTDGLLRLLLLGGAGVLLLLIVARRFTRRAG